MKNLTSKKVTSIRTLNHWSTKAETLQAAANEHQSLAEKFQSKADKLITKISGHDPQLTQESTRIIHTPVSKLI